MDPQASDLTRQKRDSERSESADLDSRYRSIGIPAVAAAARYPSGGRKPGHALTEPVQRDHEDVA